MATGQDGIALRGLQRLFLQGTAAGLTDRQLLQRFAASRDELAFATLVERHGPMVLGVCRRILRNRHDAEDAFQAAFLVLVRKAASIRVDDSLGRWLYTVTRRIALRAAAETSRREHTEGLDDRAAIGSCDRPERHEVIAAVHEELGRLPESYRAALVLCHLQGLTHIEASRRLGWPIGTVKGRLVRARGLLRSRLARRGLGLSVGGIATVLRPVTVSASLIDGTVSAAVGFAAYRATAPGMVPAATALAKGALGAMFMSKVKLTLVALAAFGVGTFVAGSGLVRVPGPGGRAVLAMDGPPQGTDGRVATKAAATSRPISAEKVSMPAYIVEPPDMIVVEVLGTRPGSPIGGERLVRPDGTISLGYYGELYVSGLTTQQIKEKVVVYLRKHLTDQELGLARVEKGRQIEVKPGDSTRVFVDISSYNSKVYYVQGEVGSPGRLPCTGNETVLDAITYAGGLVPTASSHNIRLVRPAPPGGGTEQVMPVDLAAIIEKGDTTTNYQLMPNDRVIAYRDPEKAPAPAADEGRRKAIEARIDGLIRELEDLKRELRK
jgi:polysaccharide export outer membrane protein